MQGGGGEEFDDGAAVECVTNKKNLPSKHNTKQYGFPTFPSQKVNSIIVKKKLLHSPHTTQ
jgi:hypothetical protein